MKAKVLAWAKKRKFYILAAFLGAALTPSAVNAAYEFRGYQAVGSEYLLIPLFVLIVALIEGAVSMAKEVTKREAETNEFAGCKDVGRATNRSQNHG